MSVRRIISVSFAGAVALIGVAAAPAGAGDRAADHGMAVHRTTGLVRGLRHTRFAGQSSLNWAGYVANAGSFDQISAQWRVPTVSVTADDRYSSTWIGIGGDPTPDLIQAGTEQDSIGGQPVYQAWTEILPEPETFQFTVRPGDLMQVTITQSLTGLWAINLVDRSNGLFANVSTPYPSTMTTAEWIHERTTINGSLGNLANTSNAIFDFGFANGQKIQNAGGTDTIVMTDTNGNVIATPGPLDFDGDGFQVADGSTPPPAPGS